MVGIYGNDYDDSGRLLVRAVDRNPVDVADEVAAHLLNSNDPPGLFSMGAAGIELRGGSRLLPLDGDGWLAYVARRVTFTRSDGRIISPPGAVMKLVPAVLVPELPPLDGVATTPYLDASGNVVAASGYHKASRLVLHVDGEVPAVPAAPGAEDIAQAVKLLSEEWLGDFPFASPADKANALAVLLTLTGRMFFALAPLFVIDASTAGSGKGLLVTTIALIATGAAPQVMELPQDNEEQRKKITSALMSGQELIMWDESHVIAGKTLAAIMTAETYSDRLLGGNKMFTVRNRFTQVALGNNVEVWGDMRRRVVPSRLVPDTAHPEARTDFRHPDLEQWVTAHRWELLAAVLTIWRNWITKGRPEANTGMGSFDRWARAVGGALQAAGIDGFRANTSDWLSDGEEDDGWAEHLRQLHAKFGEEWFTVTAVVDAVTAGFPAQPPVRRDPDKNLAQQLGYSYRKIRERWLGDYRLVRSTERASASGGRTWQVQRRDLSTAAASSASSGSSALQPGSTDHADHTDHRNRASERAGWPTGSIGAEANSQRAHP